MIIAEFSQREINGKIYEARCKKTDYRFPKNGRRIRGTHLTIGDRFPRIVGTLLDGTQFSLQYPESIEATLIVFWSSDCASCLHEFPFEKAIHDKYTSRGLRIVSVNSDQQLRVAKRTAAEYALPWPTVWDGPKRPMEKLIGVNAHPSLFLLDKNGDILDATPRLRSSQVEFPDNEPVVYANNLILALSSLFPEVSVGK